MNLSIFLAITALFFSVALPANGSTPTPKPTKVNSLPNLLKTPKSSSAPNYGIVINPNAKVTLDIWEDFQCGNCAKFESTNHDYLSKAISQNQIKVIYHVLSFLGSDSVVLANAAACAADEGKFLAAHDQFFNLQNSVKNSGVWSREYLLSKLSDVGINSQKFINCIDSKKYLPWVSAVQKSSSKNNIQATPTVLVNGNEINRATDYFNASALQGVIENPSTIVKASPKPTPSAYKLNFSVSKVFGVEPTIGKPTGAPPTTLGIGDLILGTGNPIQSNEKITVQYVLMEWASGKILESSWNSSPLTSSLAGLIPGWQKGLIGMKVGGRRILIIPPDLAYGDKGSGSVGPNQTLVFVIDLLAVVK